MKLKPTLREKIYNEISYIIDILGDEWPDEYYQEELEQCVDRVMELIRNRYG